MLTWRALLNPLQVPRRSRTVHPAETEAVPAVQPRGAKPPPASATGSATNALAPIQLPTRFDAVQMEAYFRRLDLDRNGQLSRSEFRRLAENVQTHATDGWGWGWGGVWGALRSSHSLPPPPPSSPPSSNAQRNC